MKNTILPALLLLTLLSACSDKPAPEPAAQATPANEAAKPAMPARSESPADATVFFVSPADGETVSNPVRVVFGVAGMAVVPAGTDAPHSGHHHLLIDTDVPDIGLPIPKDENHIHFGDGSTETEITLPAGEHKLQLLLGDHLHIPHDPPLMSDIITITVE